MRSLHQFLAWGLLASLALPLMLLWGILKMDEQNIEEKVRHMLSMTVDTTMFTLVKIAKKDQHELRWEHEYEFEYHGEMYDVQTSHETADSLTFVCWHDHEETTIKEKMRLLLGKSQNELPKTLKHQLIDFLQCLISLPVIDDTGCFAVSVIELPRHDLNGLGKSSLRPIVPPPKPKLDVFSN